MEKASFDLLNKLFVISAGKRNHQTLITDRNLLAVVWEPQLYVFHIIPHLLLKVLVPGVHYVLKDLPFYKVVREVDVKVHQDRLDQR